MALFRHQHLLNIHDKKEFQRRKRDFMFPFYVSDNHTPFRNELTEGCSQIWCDMMVEKQASFIHTVDACPGEFVSNFNVY